MSPLQKMSPTVIFSGRLRHETSASQQVISRQLMEREKKQSTAYSVSRVRRSLGHFVFGKSVGMLIGLGLLLILVRVLDVEAYSFFVASQALLEIVAHLSSFGLIVVVQRYLPELLSQQQGFRLTKLTTLLCFGRLLTLLIVIAIVYLFSELILQAIEMEEAITVFRLFLVVIIQHGGYF